MKKSIEILEKKPLYEEKAEENTDFPIYSKKPKDDRFLAELAEAFDSTGIARTKAQQILKRIDKEKLFKLYRLDEITFRCVNFYVSQVIGPGFTLVGGNKKARKTIENFIDKTHLMLLMEEVVRDMCIGGNGWLEMTPNAGGDIVDAKYVDFRYMDLERDEYGFVKEDESGSIVGYNYKSYLGTAKKIKKEEMVWFPLFGRGSELAFGFIEPLYKVIFDKLNTRAGLAQAYWRMGYPLFVGKVGDKPDNKIGYPGHKATQSNIDKLGAELEDVTAKHKIVGPYWYGIEKLKGDKIEVTPILETLDTQIIIGFGLHPTLFGVGATAKESLEIAIERDMERTIKSFQNRIKIILEDILFKRIAKDYELKEVPQILWNDVVPQDLNRAAKRRKEYVEALILNPKDLEALVREEEGIKGEIDSKWRDDEKINPNIKPEKPEEKTLERLKRYGFDIPTKKDIMEIINPKLEKEAKEREGTERNIMGLIKDGQKSQETKVDELEKKGKQERKEMLESIENKMEKQNNTYNEKILNILEKHEKSNETIKNNIKTIDENNKEFNEKTVDSINSTFKETNSKFQKSIENLTEAIENTIQKEKQTRREQIEILNEKFFNIPTKGDLGSLENRIFEISKKEPEKLQEKEDLNIIRTVIGHTLSLEETILYLKRMEVTWENQAKLINSLIERIMFKTTGTEKPNLIKKIRKMKVSGKMELGDTIRFLKVVKTSFPEAAIIKIIDDLTKNIMYEETGIETPTATGGLDRVQGG